MKMKCKECNLKIKHLADLQCNQQHCALKYNCSVQVLNYNEMKLDGGDIIADFQSPAPKDIIYSEQDIWSYYGIIKETIADVTEEFNKDKDGVPF